MRGVEDIYICIDLNNYGFFSDQNNSFQKEITEVDYVKGFAMLINLKKINFEKIFDDNFFLFLEEIDLCKRIKNNGEKTRGERINR